MPPKPPNPPSREVDDAIIATQQRLEESIHNTNLRMTEQLGIMTTKLDNQQQLMDTRDEILHRQITAQHSSLTTLLTDLLQQRVSSPQPVVLSPSGISGTPSVPPGYEFVIILTNPNTYLNTTPFISTSNIPSQASTSNFTTAPQTQPIAVPLPTPTFQQIFPQPVIHPSGYPPTPPLFPTSCYTNPIFQNQPHPTSTPHPLFPSYPQHSYSPQMSLSQPPQPVFQTPKVEMSVFDGSDPLEWLF